MFFCRSSPLPLTIPFDAAGTTAYEDYPATAADRDGGVWVVWLAYANRADQLLCRRVDGNSLGEPETLSPRPGDYYRPAVAVDGRNRLWVVWSARDGSNWDLWARRREPSGWSAPERLTSDQLVLIRAVALVRRRAATSRIRR